LTAFFLAGQAFILIGNNDTGLEFYAKHFGHILKDKPDPNLNEARFADVLANMLSAYHSKFERSMVARKGSGRGNVRLPMVVQDAEIEAIGCLLLFSRVIPLLKNLANIFGVKPGTNLSSYLRPEFKRVALAKKKVINLMRSGDIQEYKKVFRTCMVANKPLSIMPVSDTNYSDEFRQFCISNGSKEANALNKYGYSMRCETCGDMPEKLLYCPCKQVRYCSKVCQTKDFSKHKGTCQYLLKKKAAGKKAK
jgi:hypothetical protein